MNTKIIAAALALLVSGGAVADASAATVTKTKTVTATHAMRPVVVKKTVRIAHRFRRPHLAAVRVLPGHRLAPRIRIAHAFIGKRIVKTTVVR